MLDVSVENGNQAPTGNSRVELERLPLALRFGAGDPIVLSFLRAGARPRAVAVALASVLPAPQQGLDDAELQAWAANELERLAGGIDEMTGSPERIALMRDFVTARDQA